jgi:beta-hydroxylase
MATAPTADGNDLRTIGPGGVRRGTSPFVRLLRKLRPFLNRLLVPYSKVGNLSLSPPHLFPWTAELQRQVPVIRAEADAIMRHREAIPPFRDFAPGHERIVGADDWRSFFFWGYGYPVPENLARCPDTARALQEVPGLISAIYSIVPPGAHIKRHKGVNKAIMTLHLGLRVPRDAERCRIEAGDMQDYWREGEAFVLDDTYPHEVWNETDETRIILLVQFRRPMRQPGRALGSVIVWVVRHSSFVQRARRNLEYWEEAFAAAERG